MKLPLLIFAVICAALTGRTQGIEFRNADFREVDTEKFPVAWRLGGNRGDMDFSVTAGDGVLKIINRTPRRKNQYLALVPKQLHGIVPGDQLLVQLEAKGTPNLDAGIILGNWNRRLWLRRIEMRKFTGFHLKFKVEEQDIAEGTLRFYLIVESPGELQIRNLTLTRKERGPQVTVIPAEEFQKHGLLPVRKSSSVPSEPAAFFTLPLDSEHLFSDDGKPAAADGFTGKVGCTFTGTSFRFRFDVLDPRQVVRRGNEMYTGDGVQLQLDPLFAPHAGAKVTDLELGAAPGNPRAYCWSMGRELSAGEAEVVTTAIPGGYRLELELKAPLLKDFRWDELRGFSFNFLINDRNDEQGARRVAFFAPGIHLGKSAKYNALALRDDGIPSAVLRLEPVREARIRGELYLLGCTGIRPLPVVLRFTDSGGLVRELTVATVPPIPAGGIGRAEFAVNIPVELADGPLRLEAVVEGKVLGRRILSGEGRRSPEQKLQEQRKVFQTLQARSRNPKSFAALICTLFERGLTLAEADLRTSGSAGAVRYHRTRGELQLDELARLAVHWKEQLEQPQPFSMRNDAGFFIGYGHFADAIDDIPLFEKIGANFVQTEIGPARTFPRREGEFDPTYYQKYVARPLELGRKHNVKICVLLSPHVIPDWWWKNHEADLAPKPRHQMEYFYDWNAPEVRKLLKAHIEAVCRLLAEDPNREALHSICLSNEPKSENPNLNRVETRRAFFAALKKTFVTIAAFNEISGKNYPDWETLEQEQGSSPALHYAFERWKQCHFARSHRWMYEIVKKYLPDVPVHVKLPAPHSSRQPKWGTDIALFSDFSDLNGNDSGSSYRKDTLYLANWINFQRTYDMQRSFKNVPVMNTENHIIADGDFTPVPYEHVYCAIFLEALYGARGIVTWVWNRCSYQQHLREIWLDASIYYRPLNIWAQAKATSDLRRLAAEVEAFAEAPFPVALLHSHSSFLQNGEAYVRKQEEVYAALACCGDKVGFLREDRLAERNFSAVRRLFLTSTSHLSEEAIAALQEFTAAGGKLYVCGTAPRWNSYGKPLDKPLPPYTVIPDTRLTAEEMQQSFVYPEAPVFAGAVSGLVQRSVPFRGGKWLLSLVNYNDTPVEVRLHLPQKAQVQDLISGRTVTERFSLKPLRPMLLLVR